MIEIFKNKIYLYAMLLEFCMIATIILSTIFQNSIFLSSYPVDYISYSMIASVPVTLFSLLLLSPYLSSASIRQYQIILLGIVIFAMVTPLILQMKIYWFPFFFRLAILVCLALSAIISRSVMASALSLREFKKIFGYISIGGSVAGILAGIFATPLINFFGINSIIFLTGTCWAIMILCIQNLPPVIKPTSKTKNKKPSNIKIKNYPLSLAILALVMIFNCLSYLADYLLQANLSNDFTQDQIAKFFGIFSAIINALTIIFLSLNRRIIQQFGLFGLIGSAAFFIAPISFIFIFLPVLGVSAAMRGSVKLSSICGFGNGVSMILNALPTRVRNTTQIYNKSIAEPAGILLASAITLSSSYFFSPVVGLKFVALTGIVLAIAYIFFSRKIIQNYRKQLSDTIGSKIYDYKIDQSDPQSKDNAEKMAYELLKTKDDNAKLLGLALLRKVQHEFNHISSHIPKLLIKHVNHINIDIRLQSLKLLKFYVDENFIQKLLKQLDYEEAPSVISIILKILTQHAPEKAITHIDDFETSNIPEKIIGALTIYLKVGNIDQMQLALSKIQSFLQSKNELDNTIALKVLSNTSVALPQHLLEPLISSNKSHTIIHASRLVLKRKLKDILPLLQNKLGHQNVSYYVEKTFIGFNQESLPYLLASFDQTNLPKFRAILRVLKNIKDSDAAFNTLTTFLDNSSPEIRTLTLETILKRASLYSPPQSLINTIKENLKFLHQELTSFMHLTEIHSDCAIQNELTIKTNMLINRILCCLGILSKPKMILSFKESFLKDFTSKTSSTTFDQGLELLENSFSDPIIKDIVALIGMEKKAEQPSEILINDIWLEKMINDINSPNNLEIKTLCFFRKIELFSSITLFQLSIFYKQFKLRTFKANEVIFNQGEKADGMYFIYDGQVNLAGDNFNIELAPLKYFGEIGLFSSIPRMATATATCDSQLFYIDHKNINLVLEETPTIVYQMIKQMVSYLQSK